jgi:hypothetical protein
VFAAAALIFALLTSGAVLQWREAEDQRRVALARLLAMQASTVRDQQVDLALMLSVEAYRRSDTPETRVSVINALTASDGLRRMVHGHTGPVLSVAFNPDGQTLASGSNDRTIRFWSPDTRPWPTLVCDRAGRNLTRDEWRQYLGDGPYHKTCPDLPAPEG